MRAPDRSIIGRRFGKLVVVEYAEKGKWRCKCDCGGVSTPVLRNLKRGMTTSCGCMKGSTRHGLTHAPEFNVWSMMKQRCNNPNNDRYEDYGGRGIKICDRWLGPEGLPNFVADLGPRPTPLHKLERIDNDGDYEPGNCKWVTQAEQSRNRRNSIHVTFAGETMVLKDWATRLGMKVATLTYRIKNWGLERAMTEPLGPNSTSRITPP